VRVVAGSVAEGKFLALYGGGGRLHGALGVNAPRWVMPTRKLLLEQMSWEDALIAAVPPAPASPSPSSSPPPSRASSSPA
jgi:hypothetical protein